MRKNEEPAQVVEPREDQRPVPFSFGDNVVRRTSCQHFQQHLYHQVLPAVFIGHTNHDPCCTHFQPRQDGTTEPQRSQRVVDDMALVGWGVGCSWSQNGYGMSPRRSYLTLSCIRGPLG